MKILLIEDDLDDIELLEDTLKRLGPLRGVAWTLDTLHDGNAAVDYIRMGAGRPDIIILDFNLPKIHGREVVLEIKSSASFKSIPLVVLTTSSAREDIDFAYNHGVDKYLTKPTTMEEFGRIVGTIIDLGEKIAGR
jgi:CheY-like chemotaxis protein